MMIKCEQCGRECKNALSLVTHINKAHSMSSKEYYDKYLKKENEGICVVCGKSTSYIGILSGYNKHCGNVCGTLDNKVQEKIKHTNQLLYGVDNPNQSKEIIDKRKQTNLERYGYKCVFLNDTVKEKCKLTHLNNLGVENPFQSEEIKNKIKQKHLEHFGVEHPMQNKDIVQKTQKAIYNTRRSNNNRSQIELYFEDKCKEYDIDFKANYQDDRYIRDDGYKWKCDFYFPKYDMFIEIHFMATHNNHLFDMNNAEDLKWLEHCKTNPKNWVEKLQVSIWADQDVQKVNIAKKNNLKYIILWNYSDIDEFFNNLMKAGVL